MGIFGRMKKELRKAKQPRASAVIVAAGSSRRMQGVDKICADLSGSPVILRSIAAFEASPFIDEIIVVTREDLIPIVGRLCADFGMKKVRCVVKGGDNRVESVQRGLMHISREAELAAIHDGARPLVTPEVIERTVTLAAETGAAIPAVPVKDTIKKVVDGVICVTPQRSELFAAQTPQVFKADVLKAALTKAVDEQLEITDDASAVELLGMSVSVAEGDECNMKITTQADLILAEAILERSALE